MIPSLRATRIFGLWLVATLLASAAGAATLSAREDRELSLRPGQTLVVQNVNGPVTVTIWDRSTVRLQAVRTVKAPNRERAQEALAELEVEVIEDGSKLLIRTRQPRSEGGMFRWLRDGSTEGRVDYTLTVPRDARVEVKTVNGRVEARGVEGHLQASSTNGSITLDQVAGSVSASSTNGSIRATVTAVYQGAGIELSTVNGSIHLGLPAGAQADVDVRTVNGSITTDLPMTAQVQRSRSRLVGSFNGGGAPLRLRTTNGSVRVLQHQ